MENPYQQTFEKKNYTLEGLPKGEYEACIFKQCEFAQLDLSEYSFIDCQFQDCNLSLVKMGNTKWQNVAFFNCRLQGLHFEYANPFLFEVHFDHCFLNLSSFYQRQMKKAKFKHCSLHEVDFSNANLSEALFDDCDLLNAQFDQTNLEKADFRTAYHFEISPQINRMKKAKFSKSNLAGLLTSFGIIID
ncbi:pentapeptide repeat-containing protein [Aquirufa salirivi]|uniref:Pentapeptide repeat-containing protein n=1 Tax=Aquirufa salirivi TaxID=3104729 RepID=A0ABW8RUN4_9BACT